MYKNSNQAGCKAPEMCQRMFYTFVHQQVGTSILIKIYLLDTLQSNFKYRTEQLKQQLLKLKCWLLKKQTNTNKQQQKKKHLKHYFFYMKGYIILSSVHQIITQQFPKGYLKTPTNFPLFAKVRTGFELSTHLSKCLQCMFWECVDMFRVVLICHFF